MCVRPVATTSAQYTYYNGGIPMLILTRRVGETIMIDEDLAVTILGATGNSVRVGVHAPETVSVHR
jgi:carbon storage regulator